MACSMVGCGRRFGIISNPTPLWLAWHNRSTPTGNQLPIKQLLDTPIVIGLASAQKLDDQRQKKCVFRFVVSFRARPWAAATLIGVGSGHRQGVCDPFHWKSSTLDKGSREMSFFAANANSFLEVFHAQCFVAKDTLQLTDSLFQSLYFAALTTSSLASMAVLPPSLICFLQL